MSELSQAVRYDILLRIAEAAAAELDLWSVLRVTCELLHQRVPTDIVATNRIDGAMIRTHAVHVRTMAAGDTDYLSALVRVTGREDVRNRTPLHEVYPLAGSGTEHVGRTRMPFLVRDAQREMHFPPDVLWRALDVHSFVRLPLFVRDTFLGSIVFARLSATPYTEEEAAFFADLSRPLASAVFAALSYEKLEKQRETAENENVLLRQDLADRGLYGEIVGNSPAIRKVLSLIGVVAQTDSTVLITGETGSGKELVARAIHLGSSRREQPLITVHTAALPPTLLATELFGHERGAFTGALQRRLGRFELASKGTIFLDEIGDVPPETQIALLRVLQEQTFERVGGTTPIKTGARVIAATNRELLDSVHSGAFRADLYYRLNVFPIDVPPLRHRAEDIPLLVASFLARHSSRLRKKVSKVSRAAMDAMMAYSWPGNIRELANVIERGVILARGDTLYFDESMLQHQNGNGSASAPKLSLRDLERRSIEDALAAARGRVAGANGAAEILGLPPSTVDSKIKRLGIDKTRFRHAAS